MPENFADGGMDAQGSVSQSIQPGEAAWRSEGHALGRRPLILEGSHKTFQERVVYCELRGHRIADVFVPLLDAHEFVGVMLAFGVPEGDIIAAAAKTPKLPRQEAESLLLTADSMIGMASASGYEHLRRAGEGSKRRVPTRTADLTTKRPLHAGPMQSTPVGSPEFLRELRGKLDEARFGGLDVSALDEQQRCLVERGIGPGDLGEKVVHPGTQWEITRLHLQCLCHDKCLNDEVINLYMNILQVRDGDMRKRGLRPNCHFFSSHFLSMLLGESNTYNYEKVAAWTSPSRLKEWGQVSASIVDVDLIIIPVHVHRNHWTCATIDLVQQELVYYDSLQVQGEQPDAMSALRRYVGDESAAKKNIRIDTSHWKIRYAKDIPRQENAYDCGVFMLQFAERVSSKASFDFSQKDMNRLRAKIVADIMGSRFSA